LRKKLSAQFWCNCFGKTPFIFCLILSSCLTVTSYSLDNKLVTLFPSFFKISYHFSQTWYILITLKSSEERDSWHQNYHIQKFKSDSANHVCNCQELPSQKFSHLQLRMARVTPKSASKGIKIKLTKQHLILNWNYRNIDQSNREEEWHQIQSQILLHFLQLLFKNL